MSDDDNERPPPIKERLGGLEKRADDHERRIGVNAGNVDILSSEHHRLIRFYYRVLERIRRIERKLELRSPAEGEDLTHEEAAAGDSSPAPKEPKEKP